MEYEILLVDDEYVILDTIGPGLEEKGYKVTSVDNGKAAIEAVAENHFDLVITDLVMDEPDGMEVLRNTKELSPEVMVIILTGYGDMKSAIEAFRLGADDYLVKPCDIQEIYFRVSRCLEKQGLKRQIVRQTEELRESEERYRSILENIADGYYEVDLAGNLTFFNDSLCNMAGYTRDELMGMNNREYMDEEVAERVYQVFNRVYDTGKPVKMFEYQTISQKDGSKRDVESSVALIKDAEGQPIGFRGVLRDVTKRRQAEKALRESEKHLRDIYEAAENVSFITTDIERQDPHILEFSPGAERMFGFTREEAISRPVAMLHVPEDVARFPETIESLRHNKTGFSGESTLVRKSGEKFRALFTTYPILDDEGNLTATLGVSINISDRVKAEEALRESEEKFRNISESSFDMIFTTDKEGYITYASPSAERILHYEPDEVVGRHFSTIPTESEMPLVSEIFEQMLRGKEVGIVQMEVKRKDGTFAFVELTASHMMKQYEIVGTQGIIRDITERRKLEEEHLKVAKLESLGILAGGLAHDFNNILTTVMGNVAFAKMDMDRDSETYEALQEAEKASHRAKNLTHQLLTFAKGGAPVKETASLCEVIRESGSFVLKGSNVRCDFTIPEDIWPTEIDVGQISQVTQNLIINADQAMPDGGVIKIEMENRVIEAKDALPLPSGKYAHVSVKDKGIGIPEKHLPKIFDPYFSTKDKGSGLGLATAHSIIKNHGGHITVDSELGGGTLFHFYLPASEREMGGAKVLEGELIKGDGRVLVMDDEESLRNLAHQVLGRMGYHVESAKDGDEAIAKYVKAMKEGEPFDAVILDLTIPGGMGGKGAINRLKEIDPKVKAVIASGYSDDPVLANFRDYGFIGVVSKPFNLNKLSWVLHDVLTANDK